MLIQVLIPAAGDGTRFHDAGYTQPKPLIPVLGQPMIQRVIRNVRPTIVPSFVTVIAQQDLGIDNDDIRTVILGHPTRGAVETILMGIKHSSAR